VWFDEVELASKAPESRNILLWALTLCFQLIQREGEIVGKSPLRRALPMTVSIFAPTRRGESTARLLSAHGKGNTLVVQLTGIREGRG
jgi:hypothetical protein